MALDGPSATRISTVWDRLCRGLDCVPTDKPAFAGELLAALVSEHALDLPKPGDGRTAERFAALTRLGEIDLTIGRLAEAHCDAIAILAELAPDYAPAAGPSEGIWGVWAAEPPSARVSADAADGGWRLSGRKAWCSGAAICTHALVTGHADDGPRLFAVDLSAPGVSPLGDVWPTPTFSGTDTRSVEFTTVAATAIGGPGQYVARPGFWHGAAGVAAVWFGGACAIAHRLRRAGQARPLSDIDSAHLGAAVATLSAARAALLAAADSFDADPVDATRRAAVVARSTRATVETAVAEVIDRVGRALGPAPLATDRDHARRVADLQLYVRQSHADRDLAELGRNVVEVGEMW